MEQKEISRAQAKKVGNRIGVDWGLVNINEFRKGIADEFEHEVIVKGDIKIAATIAYDHLREIPNYYTMLEKMKSKI